MAKRFTDTQIWQKEWFMKLSLKQKMLVKFLFDNCDCAGIYEPNMTLISFYIGEPVTEEDFKDIKQVKKLKNGNYYIEDFISFQYGIEKISDLNPKFSVHKGIIKQLEKNGISEEPEETQTTVAMIEAKPVFFDSVDKIILNCFEMYKKYCTNLIPLSYERRNNATLGLTAKVLIEIDNDVGKFEEICKKANELKEIADKKIDYKMMLNNYIGILNGKYDEEVEESIIKRLGR